MLIILSTLLAVSPAAAVVPSSPAPVVLVADVPSLADRFRGFVARGRDAYDGAQREAMRRLARPAHDDSCADRRTRFASIFPEARVLARMSGEVYDGPADAMAARGIAEASLGDGRTAYQGETGNHYAEAVELSAERRVVIVFRGTRVSSRGNLGTDIANFAGLETPYYAWAHTLTVRVAAAHPGWDVVATGHSLGGGLALWSALSVRGVRAVAFDPAGLSQRAWSEASLQDRRRTVSSSSAFVAVGAAAMDPVTAGSVAGYSVVPARLYAIPVRDGGDPLDRHRMSTMLSGLGAAAATDPCLLDVGELGLPEIGG